MSLCHSWFGRARSKNRGLPGFFCGFAGRFFTSPRAASVLCNVEALVRIRKKRLSTSVIRRGPYSGCAAFTATACCRTSSGTRLLRFTGRLGSSPAAPWSRKAFTQRWIECVLIPNCSTSKLRL
jgi:hypothetical protein